MMTEKQSNPRTLNGTVVSNKMDKTIVVLVERRVQHPSTARSFVGRARSMFTMRKMSVKWGTW